MTQAQSGKAKAQRLADRISAVFVPTAIVVALVTFVGWIVATGDADRALTGRSRGVDRRVSVRARPRDPDRAPRGDGARRAARHPHQGP